MLERKFKAVVLVIVALLLLSPFFLKTFQSDSFAKGKETGSMKASKVSELAPALRDLWVSHIFLVRNVVIFTKYGNTEAAEIAEETTVQNARDIANSIIPYYGQEAADKLFNLLAGHYGAIKDYMYASFSGNKDAKYSAVDKLKRNAEEISVFLSSANPNWPKETLISLLTSHEGHHTAQIDAVNENNFSSEARIWDSMKNNIYVIADALARGIEKQFPNKLTR